MNEVHAVAPSAVAAVQLLGIGTCRTVRQSWRAGFVHTSRYSSFGSDFPDVLQSFAGVAFAGDTVWKLDGPSAIALWLPPGTAPDTDATVAVFERSVPADRLTELMAVFEQMDQAHPPAPHWYLAWIGIDPARQGRGLGSDLLRRCLDVIEGDRPPALLDTPNPNTVPFYQRHGFDVVGEWAAGDCPPVVSMLRRAQ